jgi:galactokinase
MTDRVYESFAPGRMDVMGGIADYSGSLVLQMPIREKTHVKFRKRTDGICVVNSDNNGGKPLHAVIELRALANDDDNLYSDANRYFKSHQDLPWAGYVVGCALVLRKEKGLQFTGGDFTITSEVPIGKGVSSSASLEVATMKTLADAFDLKFTATELPVLAQKVENLIVGAPCGLMDQLATYFGKPGKLLPIICQPDRMLPMIEVPPPLHLVGIDSGVRHSVGASSYVDVRCAAFMGYSIIAGLPGASKDDIRRARSGDRQSLPYNGFLCNISVEEFQIKYVEHLPLQMKGSDFTNEYGPTIDTITSVQPDRIYAVRDCTTHPVEENARVHEFMNILLKSTIDETDKRRLGELMFQSHASYSRCGLGSKRTDEIVNIARSSGRHGILGAKITGGGSGGTVCLLVEGERGLAHARTIRDQLCEKYNEDLLFFDGP